MQVTIHRSKPLRGELSIPGDKSITHRALLLGSLAEGMSEIHRPLISLDTHSTMQCLEALGISLEIKEPVIRILGKGLYGFHVPGRILDAGNSGTTMRLLAGILAGQPFVSHVTGDESLRRRPMRRLMEPLRSMGCTIEGSPTETAPLILHGQKPLNSITYSLPLPSAQVKSAVLLAGLLAEGQTTVIERQPSRDHTERMLGLTPIVRDGARTITVHGGRPPATARWEVPGDISSAMFLICAALCIPGSSVIMRDVGINPTRSGALDVLLNAGAQIHFDNRRVVAGEPIADISVQYSENITKTSIGENMVPLLIDEIPVLAATFAVKQVPFSVRGAAELRKKESDRIGLLVENLRTMGVEVEEYADGLSFEARGISPSAPVRTDGDHRMAMAFAVAGMAADGETTILDAECASVSFRGFWDMLRRFQ